MAAGIYNIFHTYTDKKEMCMAYEKKENMFVSYGFVTNLSFFKVFI